MFEGVARTAARIGSGAKSKRKNPRSGKRIKPANNLYGTPFVAFGTPFVDVPRNSGDNSFIGDNHHGRSNRHRDDSLSTKASVSRKKEEKESQSEAGV